MEANIINDNFVHDSNCKRIYIKQNMDYEEKYKKTLEKARKELQACGSVDCDAAKQIFRLFPELKESEDERIRKSLISYLHGLGEFDYPDKKTYNNWLVWLEKQGEHNKNHKTMIVKFICKKDWHGIGDYYYGKIYNGYPCEKEQKGYDIYDDNHVPTFCDEDFINEYFNIVTEEKQGEQKSEWSEEDRTMAFTLMRDVDQMPYYISKEGKNERIEWLNSLEDKFNNRDYENC